MTPPSDLWYSSLPGRHYAHPPIKEALIDIRVALPPEVGIETLLEIHSVVKEDYPTAKKRFFAEWTVSPGLELAPASRHEHRGYAFYSADGHYVLQARLDGFTFSRLAPYVSWEDLRETARRYWTLFERIARPTRIERVAVRFINQIDIPSQSANIDEYFLTAPKISSLLPQELSQFLMQAHLPQPEIDGLAVLTQTMVVPPPVENCVSVILDVEIFAQRQHMSPAAAWDLLDELRLRKNALFEASITDKARELFA